MLLDDVLRIFQYLNKELFIISIKHGWYVVVTSINGFAVIKPSTSYSLFFVSNGYRPLLFLV
jgi:hypothetical protein